MLFFQESLVKCVRSNNNNNNRERDKFSKHINYNGLYHMINVYISKKWCGMTILGEHQRKASFIFYYYQGLPYYVGAHYACSLTHCFYNTCEVHVFGHVDDTINEMTSSKFYFDITNLLTLMNFLIVKRDGYIHVQCLWSRVNFEEHNRKIQHSKNVILLMLKLHHETSNSWGSISWHDNCNCMVW